MQVQITRQHLLSDLDIVKLHELLTLAQEVARHDSLIAAYENPVAGLQLIPEHEYQQAIANKKLAQGKLDKALETVKANVRDAYKSARAFMPPVE